MDIEFSNIIFITVQVKELVRFSRNRGLAGLIIFISPSPFSIVLILWQDVEGSCPEFSWSGDGSSDDDQYQFSPFLGSEPPFPCGHVRDWGQHEPARENSDSVQTTWSPAGRGPECSAQSIEGGKERRSTIWSEYLELRSIERILNSNRRSQSH